MSYEQRPETLSDEELGQVVGGNGQMYVGHGQMYANTSAFAASQQMQTMTAQAGAYMAGS